ncbi:DUF2130 domain-containing protein [Candidatus Pacearchaeota archaeon]|nr:DUF2130 domain-containing protein [Candidatus Pacearchaeota archaeon]
MVKKAMCNFCGGEIPKEKLEKFKSNFKAKESEIKKQVEKDFEEKTKIERERAEEKLILQKETFENFKKTLKENYEEEREKNKKDFEKISEEKLKDKNEKISSMEEKLKEAESEKEGIEKKLEIKYKEKIKEIEEYETENDALKETLIKTKRENNEDKEKLISEFQEKIRKLENKTSDELGKTGQKEALDILIRKFPRDEIQETKRGKIGSDIFHTILYEGEKIGLIVYEVKNTKNWDNKFIKQVKDQKTKHKANYALLVTNVFPSKEKIICEKEGIIIIHSSKLDIIASQIRGFLVEAHKLRLSGEEIEEKTKELQQYLICPEYKNELLDLFTTIKDLKNIRDKEKNAHERHWIEEEKLNNKIQKRAAKIHLKIDSILNNKKKLVPLTISYKPLQKKKKKKKNQSS